MDISHCAHGYLTLSLLLSHIVLKNSSHCAHGYLTLSSWISHIVLLDISHYENRAVADVVDFFKSVCKEYLQNVFITSIFSDEILTEVSQGNKNVLYSFKNHLLGRYTVKHC